MSDEQNVVLEDGERMLSPVPMSERRPTFNQIMVWVGFGYVVTGLFIGGVLAGFGGKPGVSPQTALWAIILGMGSLSIITALLGIMAQKTGMSLALVSRYSYGIKGANLPMIIMALLTLGWFASITGMVGQIWGSFIGNPSGVIASLTQQILAIKISLRSRLKYFYFALSLALYLPLQHT